MCIGAFAEHLDDNRPIVVDTAVLDDSVCS